MVFDSEKYHKDKPIDMEEIYFILESFKYWQEEMKDRMNDAEQAVILFLTERIDTILANRQT